MATQTAEKQNVVETVPSNDQVVLAQEALAITAPTQPGSLKATEPSGLPERDTSGESESPDTAVAPSRGFWNRLASRALDFYDWISGPPTTERDRFLMDVARAAKRLASVLVIAGT